VKKLALYTLITYMAILLIVPGFLVFCHFDTLTTGEEYKFIVAPYDPYDPFHGRYVWLMTEQSLRAGRTNPYAILGKDDQGFAVVSSWSGVKPQSGGYVKNLDLHRYYMNEKMAPEAERIQRNLGEDDLIYLLVMVKNGNYVIEGLYINDIPIEEYITGK